MPKSASDSPSLAPSRKLDRDMQIPPETQFVIDFDDNRAASALVGPYGQNLALIERRLGVVVDSRGNHINVAGSRDGCDAARRVLETLYAQAVQGHELAQGDVEGAIRAAIAQGSLFEFDAKTVKSSFETVNLRKRPVRARTGRLRRLIVSNDDLAILASYSNSDPCAITARIAPSTSPCARSWPWTAWV